jgi:hypothetical protein
MVPGVSEEPSDFHFIKHVELVSLTGCIEIMNFRYDLRTNLLNFSRRRKRTLQVMLGAKREKVTWLGTCIVRSQFFVS